jgi:hypothetical protein
MEFLQTIQWTYVASGFAVGMLVGLTGVGGGSLMTPILVLVFGISPVTAVGTDLLYASATKTAGSLVHGFNHTIEWRVVGRLALGSVPAAAVTLLLIHELGISSATTNLIVSKVLGVALILTAVALTMRPLLLKLYRRRVGSLDPRRTRNYTILTGVVVGAGHWLLGSVNLALLGTLLIGSLPGIFLGSVLAPRVPDVTLRFLLAGVLVVSAMKLLQ